MSENTATKPEEGIRLHQQALGIHSREDFVAFARALTAHLRQKPEEWENRDLPSYLDALAAWVEDMDGYFQNQGEQVPDPPSWKALGQMMLAAKMYE